MPDFSNRSTKKEILDQDNIPFSEIERNMKELEVINKYLGGHSVTLKGLKQFQSRLDQKKIDGSPLTICEIGCGGGDNLKAIYNYCRSEKLDIKLIGVDINKNCLDYAKKNCKGLGIEWILSDYIDVVFPDQPDIIFSSLFSHHFSQIQLVEQYDWMFANSRNGFFVNDLHRHPIAYYSIRLLTALFSRSQLVKNDAPLSVLRGFRRKDFEELMQQYADNSAQVKWKWAFRWLIVVRKGRTR